MSMLQKGIIPLLLLAGVEAHCQLWKEYADSALIFQGQKNTIKAIEYYTHSKTALEKDSVSTETYALICDNLAAAFFSNRQQEEAEKYYLRAKQVRENLYGRSHVLFAASCNSLGAFYYSNRKFDKAEPLYLEAKKIREEVLGKEHPLYAQSCHNTGTLYYVTGQYEKGEPLLREALHIREKAVGKDHADYGGTCNNLGLLYLATGELEKAEPLFLEAIRVRAYVFGKDHADYAGSCNNLGVLYRNTGKFTKAEQLYVEVRRVREKIYGRDHPEFALNSMNLATLYMSMGAYEKAEPLYLLAKQTLGNTLGKEHPQYATCCNNLGNYYRDMGQYARAEPLYREAMLAQEKVLGKENIEYARSCSNLANIFIDQDEYAKAEPLYLEAKQIWEKTVGKEHQEYAIGCQNLALLYFLTGRYEKAKPLYTEAKQIWEKSFGKEDPDYATSCANLANLFRETGQFTIAEPLYLEAQQIREKVLGKEHPDYAVGSSELANLYRQMQDERALAFFEETYQTQVAVGKRIFSFTSEKEKETYLKSIQAYTLKYLSYIFGNEKPGRTGFAWDVILANRNQLLAAAHRLRQSIFNTSDTAIFNRYNDWVETKKQLAFWLVKPVNERNRQDSILEERADGLEKELSRVSASFRKEQEEQNVSWVNIRQSLKPAEAAIEFSTFQYFNGKHWTDSTYYIALVLRKDKQEPELVKLFEQRQLDSILAYKTTSAGQQQLNLIYTGGKNTGTPGILYDKIWKPLESKLAGIKTVYFAPAGDLYKIAFGGLPTGNGEVLSDTYKLVQLRTTASLLNPMDYWISAGDKVHVFGGVQYDADSASLSGTALKNYPNDIAGRSLPDDLQRDGVPEFMYLVGTEREALTIENFGKSKGFPIASVTGINATEEAFKSLSGKNSPFILHIATHGFFFPDPRGNKKAQRPDGSVVFKQSDNPLIRSGLALAGANNAWKGKPVKGIEDGILTAYEVSNMYLPNTKLAVLSACETGLGDIQGSEGVYGLQRAFKMAGVENLVMSLWKVPDSETAEFMQEFYKNLFSGKTISDSFYHAQTEMKTRYRKEPYKWAAWVLVR